jgi:predicted nucleic acid-binding Zn ribbon protein
MPKMPPPNKRSVPKRASRPPRNRASSPSRPPAAHSVKDLLARAVPVLSQAADQTARQAFWRRWLQERIPAELYPKITAITERDGSLVVFADSPAWSARLRYALQELHARIREADPDIEEVCVRVMPRPGK